MSMSLEMEIKPRILKSTQNELERKSTKYKVWRSQVFLRDNFTCQDCGSKIDIHPHHIKPFAKYKELRFEVSNGQTLCSKCHGQIHGINFSKTGHFLTCSICKIRFRPVGGHLKQQACSKKCGYVLRSQSPSKKKGQHYPHLQKARLGICLECGGKYRAIQDYTKHKQKYCSHTCYLKNRWENYTGKKATKL